MGGHSFTVRAAGAMGPASAVLVTVQNLGPERAFSARVSVAGRQTASAVGCTIPRMGRGTLEIPVPDIGADSPMDVTAEVTVTAEDGASSSQTLRFKYLPRGWFDRLDPDLCSEIGRFATEGCTASDETGHLSADMRSAYGSLSEVKPRPETAGRYMRVSGPDEMRDFGDCTECEAAVAYVRDMVSSGHTCCIVRLGDAMMVGCSDGTPADAVPRRDGGEGYIYLRPYEGCLGMDIGVSMDRSYSRLRGIVTANGNGGARVAPGLRADCRPDSSER